MLRVKPICPFIPPIFLGEADHYLTVMTVISFNTLQNNI